MRYNDVARHYGTPGGFVAWSGARMVRTDDITAASPTWEAIDSGVTGSILDCQVVPVSGSVCGAWLMTTAAVYWCADIEAAAPVWTSKLAQATTQASDAAPEDGASVFKCMVADPANPLFCIVATGPLAEDGLNLTYAHAYFWYTSDGGATWSQSDYTGVSSFGGGYCFASLYSMEVQPGGDIWCVRSTDRSGLNSVERVLISADGGVTWGAGVDFNLGLNNNLQVFSLLGKRAGGTSAYVVIGSIGASNRPDILHSGDDWATVATLTSNGDPVGYGGLSNLWTMARVTQASEHVRAWFRHTANTDMHLLESEDGGDTWSLLWDSGADETTIDNTNTGGAPGAAFAAAPHNIPVVWPSDPAYWVLVRARQAALNAVTLAVQATDDDFVSLDDKTGNLAAEISTWIGGPAWGFYIPKAAVSWSEYAVGDGHDVANENLTALAPQPTTAGVKVTRRTHDVAAPLQDEFLYLELVYSALGSVAEYQAVLTAFGVLSAMQNEITVTVRDATLGWVRFNGTAVRPQMSADVQWSRYFPRDVVILVKELTVAA